jgi:hypothetical protein
MIEVLFYRRPDPKASMDLTHAPVSRNRTGKMFTEIIARHIRQIFSQNIYFGVPGAGSDPGKNQRRNMYSSHHDELYFWFSKK